MKYFSKNIIYLILGIVLIIGIGIIYMLKSDQSASIVEEENKNTQFLKNYDVNEFMPVYLSKEQIASIYLNDYIQNMLYHREEAYLSLDAGFKKTYFPTFEDYDSYVEDLLAKSMTFSLKSASEKSSNSGKVYTVLDTNGYSYTFEVTAVMVYTVQFNTDR